MGVILILVVRLGRIEEVPTPPPGQKQALFAGGCFWSLEAAFENQPGVSSVISGYAGHREAVLVTYDAALVTYPQLLEIFWRNVDPTDADGQFLDRGSQYSTAILYLNQQQRLQALTSKDLLTKTDRFPRPITTTIATAPKFVPAAEYNQDYYRKSPINYSICRYASGRDRYRKTIWGDRERSQEQP